MDIIIQGLLLIGIENFGAVNVRDGLGRGILVLHWLLALLEHHHLIFGFTLFLQILLVPCFIRDLGWRLTDIKLRAYLHLHWSYRISFLLVWGGAGLSFVGPAFCTNYFAGRDKVSGTFLKFILLITLFLVIFLGLLKTPTLAHLCVISVWGGRPLLLHLCGHHSLMTFLLIKIDAVVDDLTLVMKKPLNGPLINDLFGLVNWRIQKPFIVLDLRRLKRLQSLVGMHSLIVGGSLLDLHLLVIWLHLVALGIGKHVLRRNWVLLHFSQSLIWSLLMLHSPKIGLLNCIQCFIAIYRVVRILNTVVVNWQSALRWASVWRIKILVLADRTILLGKVLGMWLYHFPSLFAHLVLSLFTLNHQFLLILVILVLREHFLVDLSSATDGICLKILVRGIWRMNIATWQTSFPPCCSLRCNLLREIYPFRVEVRLAQILSDT